MSGSKGLQIYIPLNTVTTYAAAQRFARSMAQHLEREYPDLVVSEMAKVARTGKIFIDWSQNSDFKTTVGVYSMRAKRTTPFISMPVSWEELQAALDNEDPGRLYWHPDPAIERLAKIGDLFAPVLKLKQRLPSKFEPEQPARATRARPRSLNAYEAKRDFAQTAEPAPSSTPRRSQQGGRRRFVIQKHAASHLHCDFRLEMHDVLKSWAVPKGVPYTLDEKRLAMATEDHPLEYLDFEGVIPKGQYGGGTVMVWDIGTYELIDGNYYKGKLHLFLQGSKLKGEWLLQRDAAKGERGWLMTKIAPAVRRPAARKEDLSALTQRTMAQIAADKSAEWQSNRPAAGKAPKRQARAVSTPHIDLSALSSTTLRS